MRNALAYANKSQRQMVFALINTIFAQETADAAHAQWRIVSDQLREKLPKLAAMMDAAEHEVLTFMDFPKEHRVKIHSTNVLERLNGEIKRRADVVGILPNEAAVRRLAGGVVAGAERRIRHPETLHESGIVGDDQRESADQAASSAGAGLTVGSSSRRRPNSNSATFYTTSRDTTQTPM